MCLVKEKEWEIFELDPKEAKLISRFNIATLRLKLILNSPQKKKKTASDI